MIAYPTPLTPSEPVHSTHVLCGICACVCRLLTVLAATVALAAPAFAQGSEECPGAGDAPTPTEVAVTTVPIVVASTTADYFVLYVRHDLQGKTVTLPVLVKRGEAGTTTLAENVSELPAQRYKVEKYLIADPADVDGDCTDDITELNSLGSMNPVSPAAAIELSNGAGAVPDRSTFNMLSKGRNDDYRSGKIILYGMGTARPGIYFINTNTLAEHRLFLELVGLERSDVDVYLGHYVYDVELLAPDGSQGLYYFWLEYPFPSFPLVDLAYSLFAASMPLLDDNTALFIHNVALQSVQSKLPLYRASRMHLLFEGNVRPVSRFLALNPGVGFGRLQALDPDDRPHPRDIVLYEALPNELPRVAGIISTAAQTPLSHVNLRAVQNGIPNAYIPDALDDPDIASLMGGFVRYEVTESGWDLRGATPEEVEAHYESSRPAQTQTPERDLSVTGITPLSQIGFNDWKAFGVKAANLAELRKLGFPEGTVPDGFAIPFYFYDTFMNEISLGEKKVFGKRSAPEDEKFTLAADVKLIDAVKAILAHPKFRTDFEIQDEMLDDLRDAIRDATSPQWMIDALTAMHDTYPEGQSLRYRSSTNNEDLPGFNGAGLYDSNTQHAHETEEDGIDKSMKQVFASLWTFRAFTEREFHRIDHLAAAMGILVHPNFSDELANGVAVSFDPILDQDGYYYFNTQLGEDLVTNPEAHSLPEEILIQRDGASFSILGRSNLVEGGKLLMSRAQRIQLRDHLTVIHDHFKGLYNPSPGEPFAMEIEFKITSDNILAIKQARPWVFEGTVDPPPPPPFTGGGGGGGGGGGLLFPPQAPVILTAAAGDGAVRLEWSPPGNDGGSEIRRYEYRLKEGRGEYGEWAPIPDSAVDEVNASGYTLMGLDNGTIYVFELRAVNAAGNGRVSEAVEVVMPLDPAWWSNFRAEDLEGVELSLDAFLLEGASRDRQLRFGEGLRFEEDELDGEGEVTATQSGSYGYGYTSRTTGELSLDFDEGESCELRLTFSGEGAGSYSYRCGGSSRGQGASG